VDGNFRRIDAENVDEGDEWRLRMRAAADFVRGVGDRQARGGD
jgi:hypothetical protein